jgi:uncharacterized protein YidB (DUF937 family)
MPRRKGSATQAAASAAEEPKRVRTHTEWPPILHKLLSYYCEPNSTMAASATKPEHEQDQSLREYLGAEAHDELKKKYFAALLTTLRQAGIRAQKVARIKLGDDYKGVAESQLGSVLADDKLSAMLSKWGLHEDRSFILKLMQPKWPKSKAKPKTGDAAAAPAVPPAAAGSESLTGHMLRFWEKFDDLETKVKILESKVAILEGPARVESDSSEDEEE